MRDYVRTIARSALVILICVFIGSSSNRAGTGWIAGIVVCAILGYADKYTVDRWTVEIIFQLIYLQIYLVGFTSVILLVILTLIGGILATLLGMRSYLSLVGLTVDQFLVDALFRNMKEPQIVGIPRSAVDRNVTKLLGPRPVTIQPDTAAIMVRGAKQTRILGPETIFSNRSEYVQKVYNLKPIHKDYEFIRVLTKDLISTQVRISITYGVNVATEARLGERQLNEEEISNIRNLNSWSDNWEQETRSIVEQQTRFAVGQHLLPEASDVVSQPGIETNVRNSVNEKIMARGIKIYDLQIVSLEPDKTISEAREENWLTDIRGETLIKQEAARSEAWKSAIASLADAFEEAQSRHVPEGLLYRELLRRILEQVTVDPSNRRLIPPELQRLLINDEKNES